jgi:glyoxylase-like metal-dependent hydrolase (beta-lactamase superfamily II)
MVDALAACGAAPRDVARLLVTHPHIDHYGMAGRFVDQTGCETWMHERARDDLEVYRDPAAVAERVRRLFADHGVDEKDLRDLSSFEDLRPYVSGLVEADRTLRGEETFDAGSRTWGVVYTPGHSRSHVCLLSDDGIFISGDHLLPSITPHIDFQRGAEEDPLGDYLDSLAKVEELGPTLVLPGHGKPFDDGADRARAIARHHDRRLGSILQVVRSRPRTASQVTEEIFGPELLDFERRLALGEALAHLAYLRVRGEVERIQDEQGTFLYRKVPRRPGADEEDDTRA